MDALVPEGGPLLPEDGRRAAQAWKLQGGGTLRGIRSLPGGFRVAHLADPREPSQGFSVLSQGLCWLPH